MAKLIKVTEPKVFIYTIELSEEELQEIVTYLEGAANFSYILYNTLAAILTQGKVFPK
jgi:hypothetical protein